MKHRLILASALALGLGSWAAGTAEAEMCTTDVVPAATLLAPYFEVDTTVHPEFPEPTRNTVLTLHNALAQPVLLQVTLWTDYSIPSVYFHIYLTGYDMVRFDLADTFLNGNIPMTADAQSDPGDTISPHGANPEWDGSFQDCDQFFPLFQNPVLGATHLDRLRNGHTGQPVASSQDQCLGASHGDTVARGYITVDVVNRCAILAPNEAGYFDGPTPYASTTNAVWGEWSFYDTANNFSFTEPLVHIEADPSFDASTTPTGYTFYGRFTQSLGGVDHREPLGTAYGMRYLTGAPYDGTDFIVWRDSTSSVVPDSVACDGAPPWYPLQETEVACFNEQEDLLTVCGPDAQNDPACFPLETQRVAVGSGELALPFNSGWCRLNLNVPSDQFSGDVDFPSHGGDTTQSYAVAVSKASGLFQVGWPAVRLGHACDAASAPSVFSIAREVSHD